MEELPSFSSRISVLEDAVNKEDITRKRLGKELEGVLKDFYNDKNNVKGINPQEFFYAAITYVGFVSGKIENSAVLNYLSEMIGSKFLSSFSFFQTRSTIIYPFTDADKDELVFGESLDILRGDQCLYNSGILYKHSGASREFSGHLQFRSLGEKSYMHAAERQVAPSKKILFSTLSKRYLVFESVLREVSDKYVFGKYGMILMKSFTNFKGNSFS